MVVVKLKFTPGGEHQTDHHALDYDPCAVKKTENEFIGSGQR